MAVTRQISIPLLSGASDTLEIKTGATILIAGPNGVGKSALLHSAGRSLGSAREVEILPGHRSVSFQNADMDSIGQTVEALQSSLLKHVENFNRYRSAWSEQHLKSIVKRLTSAQFQANDDIVEEMRASGGNIAEVMHKIPKPLDVLNRVFAQARMAVSFKLDEGQIRACRDGGTYGIDLLSDGERAGLLLVGAILVRPSDSFIAIDEPELHLHPSISGPLIGAAIRARPDVGFLISSHDLQLIEWLSPEYIIHVRNSVVTRTNPEVRQYDVHVLSPSDGIREELKIALLGSRRSLLFVEGEVTSEDRALYSLVYPGRYVVPRGGADTVISDVKALRANESYHWLQVHGLVDGDGRDSHELQSLAASGIAVLPSPQIENMFCNRVAIEQMAAAIAELKGKQSAQERLSQMRDAVLAAAASARDEIVYRKATWRANRQLQELKVSVNSIRNGQRSISSVDLEPLVSAAEAEIDALLAADDVFALLTELPIKNSSIPNTLAVSLGYDDFKDFQGAVLNQIESGTPAGVSIQTALRGILPQLG